MIKGLLALIAIFLIATFPATWLLMLFLGNVHENVSYWGALPLGVVVSALIGAASLSDLAAPLHRLKRMSSSRPTLPEIPSVSTGPTPRA